jgi:predicted nucleic acid-binding protein
LKRAHAAGSSLHIDIVVLGEFVNRCLRLEHRMLRSYDAVDWDYKVYRASPEYAASVVQVSRNALSILSYCRPIESGFSRCNLTALLGRFGAGQSDLSDEFIVATCQREGYTLVTDDADFVHSDLKILTRNARYFSRA